MPATFALAAVPATSEFGRAGHHRSYAPGPGRPDLEGRDDRIGAMATDPESEEAPPGAPTEPTQVWLVERTYSDDEQNIIIPIYATPDGEFYHPKERALTSFTSPGPATAAVEVDPGDLGRVDDDATREQYATEAERMAGTHDPDDPI